MLKRFLIVSATLFITVFPIINTAEVYADTGSITVNSINTRAPIIEWRYKVINSKLYKRQFNHSTKKWIGNWILVT